MNSCFACATKQQGEGFSSSVRNAKKAFSRRLHMCQWHFMIETHWYDSSHGVLVCQDWVFRMPFAVKITDINTLNHITKT
jgi:hypothetical protein